MSRPHALTLTLATLAAAASAATFASSHREAPYITQQPKADNTDFYMFRSYEPGRENFVTIIANFIPFQEPFGGPNYYMFDPKALYEIHLDNNGDAVEDITLQFRFDNVSKDAAVSAGTKSTKIPLIVSGQVTSKNAATLNVRETYSIDVVRGDRRGGSRTRLSEALDKPVDNIGQKTIPDYPGYAAQHTYSITLPGCATPGRVFVGQRKESFYVALGKTFDLFNLDPLGPEAGGNNNDLEDKNITSIAVELPIACVASAGDPVVGGWSTASLRQARLVDGNPPSGLGMATREGGPWAQVSRLGMPLVNEVVIGLPDKDRFNASKPRNDGQFLDYVTHPSLPELIEKLFPSAPAPNNFPRTDLVAAFLTGISGLNQPKNVVASEMLRLNTSIAPTPAASQNPLGVAANDFAGFPNGRRPADDVVDVSLRVAMGALCVLTGAEDKFKVGCKPEDAPSGGQPFTDGVRKTAANYLAAFPYLTTPIPGNFNPPPPPGTTYP